MNSNWLQRLLNGSGSSLMPHLFPANRNAEGTTHEEIDAFLANSMAQLDVQQRETVLEDLHCIRNRENPESNPASVDQLLRLLDMHLQKVKGGTVYETAEAIDRTSVTSRRFRIMFLRANRYDPQAAAAQVIKYLELKRSLFGQEKLTKKISLADLNEDDKDYLESGTVQISTKRDRSGRIMYLLFPSLRRQGTDLEALLRGRFYSMMALVESEENQINGVVMVYFGALPSQADQHSAQSGLLWDLPIFYAGIHCCFTELSTFLLISVAILRLPFNLRPRVRVHYGSCEDCLYKLSSFGIPKDAIVTGSNEPVRNEHLEWYRKRQEMELMYVTDSDTETQSLASVGAIIPRSVDVLFGPGSRNNEGNVLMRKLVLVILDEYNESRKPRKMQLTENIINEVQKKGGRFLKQHDETKEWQQASHTEACRKIAHTFRNIRRPSRAKTKS
ncbi:MAG: hypothetical protein SGBAC_007498 [Bacillariaceae sp.]